MTLALVILLAIALLVGVYFVMVYNALVQVKHNVSKAWANIEVLLKQRHDELPKLIETCRQYMKFEQDTLQRVIEARGRVHAATQSQDVAALGPAEGALRMGLGNLFALAESYPDLKANASFQQLQSRISALEDSIADRREFYNESVNINNVRIEQVPDVFVARLFGFTPFKLLEFTADETHDVDVKQLFS
ncbi:MAG: LemA family protein [Rhodocyclaceae bacterium]|jgi:LemA protein|nr:LemA family protein [Rhodocyclaceae bacterium]MCA3075650.1 LemA family protein [Rhodocyclaceae bacterium]MCA3089454.1 LemA family protein [Rhodocyclaceae bacterium]MCA3093015.1 LemA family protein [Rhodocyclaceae bacterium]MCA3096894.1 LemA family protein [Rhodocyclaceae bacterium]